MLIMVESKNIVSIELCFDSLAGEGSLIEETLLTPDANMYYVEDLQGKYIIIREV